MGKIVVNKEYCKGCELCTAACAFKLIRLGKEFNRSGYYFIEFTDPEGKCTGCALCAEMCPDVAIEVWKEEKPRAGGRKT
jgi:2-oxoglutarate ferredoxin oxidoreductase subunit delta